MIYRWKESHQPSGSLDPQAVGEQLAAIHAGHGVITAGSVVDAARPEDALLHPAFEWDDAIAAEEYRLEQARSLVRHVVSYSDDQTEAQSIRAFVVVTEVGETAYVPTNYAMGEPNLRAQVIARALSELRQFQRKYHEIKELADIFSAIERITNVA